MYGYGYPYGFYVDPTYVLLIIGMVLALAASAKDEKHFCTLSAGAQPFRSYRSSDCPEDSKCSRDSRRNRLFQFRGSLTDHYDPRTKRLALSQDVYGRTSVAAVCVAAHECGHAIQHNINYAPLNIRSAIVPVANIGSSLSWPIFLLGLILSIPALTTVGIVLFSLAVLFQLVTLPVEFNASSRALKMLESTGILSREENKGAKKVLTAAALTYVAALASSILQLLRLIILSGGRRSG